MIRNYNIPPEASLQKGTQIDNFQLLRRRSQPPILIGQPIDNVFQFKYQQVNGTPILVQPVDNTVFLYQNTPFSVTTLAVDPSNLIDIVGTGSLTYVWRFNGEEIYATNNQNQRKGSPTLRVFEQQATPNINGAYVCEVSNDFGTTVSSEFNIEIVDPTKIPLYYTNLIKNGCGEAGLSDWEASDRIAVNEFSEALWENNNFGSMPTVLTSKTFVINQDGSESVVYADRQPMLPFKFLKNANWANLERFFDDTQFATNIEFAKWWRYKKPNLIQNEHPQDPFASFFPSLKHVDDYNENSSTNGLMKSFAVSSTYFTRKPIEFKSNAEPKIATMTQTIDLTQYKSHLDGYVVGINEVVGRFFCYVGLGLDKYEYELVVSSVGTNGGANAQIATGFNEIVQAVPSLQGKIPDDIALWNSVYTEIASQDSILIPEETLIPRVAQGYVDAGGIFVDQQTVISPTSKGIPTYNSFVVSAKTFEKIMNGDTEAEKILFDQLGTIERINLRPKVHNSVSIQLAAIIEDTLTLTTSEVPVETIEGPGLNELMAVKEKVLLSYMIDRVFKRAGTFAGKIPVYYGNKKFCDIGLGSIQFNAEFVKEKMQNYPQEYYSLDSILDSEFGSDPGVQAFFAVGKNFSVPQFTRLLRVTVNMSHESIAYNNTQPDTGELTWANSIIYDEHFGKINENGQFFEANYPKVAITQMKLCLYDNTYKRYSKFPTYFIPRAHILKQKLKYMEQYPLDDSQSPSYSYQQGPVGVVDYSDDTPAPLNITNPDLINITQSTGSIVGAAAVR